MYVYIYVCVTKMIIEDAVMNLRGGRERHGRSLTEGGEGNDVNLTLMHEILKHKVN